MLTYINQFYEKLYDLGFPFVSYKNDRYILLKLIDSKSNIVHIICDPIDTSYLKIQSNTFKKFLNKTLTIDDYKDLFVRIAS